MQNALQNETVGVSPVRKPPFDSKIENMLDPATETAEDLVMRIAQVAGLADQCEREGNQATAIALRRVAEALWGDAFHHHPKAKPEK